MDILLVIHIFITVSLIGVILLQRSGTDGLSGIGGGGGNSLMSARATGNFLTRLTAILAALFMANSLLLAYIAANTIRDDDAIIDNIVAEDTQLTPASTEEIPEKVKGKATLPIAE